MSTSSLRPIPGTPRVISPSPDPTEASEAGKDSYFASPVGSISRRSTGFTSPPPIDEDPSKPYNGTEFDQRARSRSRSIDVSLRKRRVSGLTAADASLSPSASISYNTGRRRAPEVAVPNGTANGHLSPASAAKGSSYWRQLSRSPSPLGLIPIHREWRTFVHRHEIPRKALHVSIGFLTLGLYAFGYQTSSIHPVLLSLLIPIALVDLLRHNYPPFNLFYIRILGAFMRESEAFDKYNGVIWYLLGTWTVMRFCPKDIAVMSVCLLSWSDTAASTFGRLWGRYTPRIRRGKSLAGSLAAFAVGIGASVLFWGWMAPQYEIFDSTGVDTFAYQGRLTLPTQAAYILGLTTGKATVSDGLALGIISVWAGFVASVSEAVDIFGWDDNVTIPILSGFGLWGFLKAFGAA